MSLRLQARDSICSFDTYSGILLNMSAIHVLKCVINMNVPIRSSRFGVWFVGEAPMTVFGPTFWSKARY